MGGESAASCRRIPQSAPAQSWHAPGGAEKPFKSAARVFNALTSRLINTGALKEMGPVIYLPAHEIRFTPQQKQAIDQLMARFAQAPYSTSLDQRM